MHRSSMRRVVGAAAALLLVGAALFSSTGAALAATTRFLYVGPDPAFSDATNGTLAFTAVSAGGSTLSTLYVKNVDNQTLNHVVLTFARTQGSVSISDTVLGANAGNCSASTDTITCDFGSLKAKALRSFSLILTASAAGGQAIHGTVVFNESNNPNGGNQQINSVDATLTVADATCNALATFLPPGIAKTLVPEDGTACAADGQRSGLKVPPNANGTTVEINDDTLAVGCGSLVCFGNAVSAIVNNGAPVSPYLTWQIFYSNAVLGNINPKQVAFLHDATVIQAGNKGLCKNASSVNCQEPYLVSSAGVTFFVRTPSNGLIRGMH